MAITSIQNVTNVRDHNILFINTESSGNNREITPRTTKSVGNCWIPWCARESEFATHHIEIIDTSADTVLWYIWQQNSSDGDLVRASRTGFAAPGPQISGDSRVGRSYNLFIDADAVTASDS